MRTNHCNAKLWALPLNTFFTSLRALRLSTSYPLVYSHSPSSYSRGWLRATSNLGSLLLNSQLRPWLDIDGCRQLYHLHSFLSFLQRLPDVERARTTTNLIHTPTMTLTDPTLRALLFQLHYLFSHPLTRLHSITNSPGETWVVIRGDATSIEINAAAQHYEGAVADLSQVPEALRGPIWSNTAKWYLAFGVDLARVRRRTGSLIESWAFSSFEDEEEYLDPRDRERILPELVDKIKAELKLALDLLDLLDHRGGLQEADVDKRYSGEDLANAAGREDTRTELRRAREIMDERLAAINFGLVRAELDVRTYVELAYAPYIEKWALLNHMRGVQIDFRTFNPERTHVLDLLHHKVPVFYPLDAQYRPRLTEAEVRAVESVRSGAEFAYWLRAKSHWPKITKSLPTPYKLFGVSPELEAANPGVYPPRAARRANLLSIVKVALGDTLHPASIPIVPTLAAATVTPLDLSRLIVDPMTELRMMVRAIEGHDSDPKDLLAEGLLRGWAFKVVYPRGFLDDLSTVDDFIAGGIPDEFDLVVLTTDSENIDVAREWTRYLRQVAALLSRPNAKAFLFLGGIYWRLAILLGSRYLAEWMQDVLTPSASVLLHRSGAQYVQGYWTDSVSDIEKDMLLGLSRSRFTNTVRTWFPRQSLLDRYGFDDGQWSRLEELFVLERYESLQRGETTFRPLTHDEWDAELRDYRKGKLLRDSYVSPSSFELGVLLRDIREELGGGWKGATLEEVRLAINDDDD